MSLLAYIGPGAGIALLGSFLAIFIASLSAIGVLLTWPVRTVWRTVRGRRALARAKVRRVVILGLDGLDPVLTERFLDDGLLPHLAVLRQHGSYRHLGTTWPPLSPVAWSSFSTGTNPGKHHIFDFIARTTDYRPAISSVRIDEPPRHVQLGSYRIPVSRPSIRNLRMSKPVWKVLSDSGIFSAVLRVPITFPPDKFHGVQLAAMCVPDIRGTQGTFTFYTESGDAQTSDSGDLGGQCIRVDRNGGDTIQTYLPGPANPLRRDRRETTAPLTVSHASGDSATLAVGRRKVRLAVGDYSDWIRVEYRLFPGFKLRGLCRFYLKKTNPLELYCTPVQIDPARPVMPLSQPRIYAGYLARLLGSFATLGLAEDTWALSERRIDEDAFLTQAYDIHGERRAMFFDAMDRVRRGMVTCVFDAPDRIQHMFWRFIDRGHPALPPDDPDAALRYEHVIREMYVRMDRLVGETVSRLSPHDALFVMSDHGFKPFRRGVDLNAWLLANGYLKLKGQATTSQESYLREVDWAHTKAYALGLAGIYVNQKGRERQGTVARGEETTALLEQLRQELTGLTDPDTGEVAIREAVPRQRVYDGPYAADAPDLIMGYNVGYRVAWDAAVGKCGRQIISDNKKAWSGDHCVHPDLVPGILFSNWKLSDAPANIIDLAPTALELLGVNQPKHIDGKSLLCDDATS